MPPTLAKLRRQFIDSVHADLWRIVEGSDHPNNSDDSSKDISLKLAEILNCKLVSEESFPQTKGTKFEGLVEKFLHAALPEVQPNASWLVKAKAKAIDEFDQYSHLKQLSDLLKDHPEIEAAMAGDYLVKPDVVVARVPVSAEDWQAKDFAKGLAKDLLRSPLIDENATGPTLIASVSCKWTIRSDRGQNARTEALNLLRNRKGRAPNIVAVTFEPLPSRIGAIALGTGDLDMTYHVCLPELMEAVKAVGKKAQKKALATMVDGRRLRDVADLPIDLSI